MANCGMGVAMDIGVIPDHVPRLSAFLARRSRCLEANYARRDGGTISPLRRCERVPEALNEFVSELGFEREATA